MKRILGTTAMAVIFLFAGSREQARSADITESFSNGVAGWQASVALGAGYWQFNNDAVVTFVDTGFLPIPDVGVLAAAPAGASGALTGDLLALGAEVIGFRVSLGSAPPAGVNIEVTGLGTIYQSRFRPDTPGEHVVAASLLDDRSWELVDGPATPWSDVVRAVDGVAVKIYRSGVSAQSFTVDDLFLARAPTAADLVTAADGSLQVGLQHLHAAGRYHLDTAASLTGTWIRAHSTQATGSVHWITLPGSDGPSLFWRIVGP
jgi:hypothetical protein